MNNATVIFDELEMLGIFAGTLGKDSSGLDPEKDIKYLLDSQGLDLSNYAYLQQEHGTEIQVLKEAKNFCAPGDALLTNVPNVLLFIRTADCYPVFIVDIEKHVVALVHAGWRSAYGMILSKTIEKMSEAFDCNPNSMMVFIGPGLQRESFEVQEDFLEHDNFIPYIDQEDERYLFDLNQYLQDEAMASGIDPENILDLAICTYQNNDLFYSYRKGDQNKRNYSFICIQ